MDSFLQTPTVFYIWGCCCRQHVTKHWSAHLAALMIVWHTWLARPQQKSTNEPGVRPSRRSVCPVISFNHCKPVLGRLQPSGRRFRSSTTVGGTLYRIYFQEFSPIVSDMSSTRDVAGAIAGLTLKSRSSPLPTHSGMKHFLRGKSLLLTHQRALKATSWLCCHSWECV